MKWTVYIKIYRIWKCVIYASELAEKSFFIVEDLIYELSPHDNKINKRQY